MTKRICKDCVAEGRPADKPVLNIKHINGKAVPGPRCSNHWRAHKKAVKAAKAGKRGLKVYNVTPDDWAKVLDVQNGVCAWCLRPPTTRQLAKDHDHSCCPGDTSCGQCLRGGLCWTCNKFLQHLGDDPELVHRGWEYLTNPPAHIALRAGNV